MRLATSQSFLAWHFQLDSLKIGAPTSDGPITYFQEVVGRLKNRESRRYLFVSDLFHAVAGISLLRTPLSDRDKLNVAQYVSGLWTGGGFTTVLPDSPFSRLMRTQVLPSDLYSTYYALGLLILIQMDIRDWLLKIADTFRSYFQPSGWVYNSVWTETIEERRFDIELCQQALMATRLALLLDIDLVNLPFHKRRMDQLNAYLSSARYVTAAYYAAQCLKLIHSDANVDCSWPTGLTEFLLSHFNEQEGGFQEYRLENVKVFRYRGMDGADATATHRFQSDSVSASINATTYALWFTLAEGEGVLTDFVAERHHPLAVFFQQQQPATDGGYGTPVMIAKYATPLGPQSTPLETVNLLIGKELLSN